MKHFKIKCWFLKLNLKSVYKHATLLLSTCMYKLYIYVTTIALYLHTACNCDKVSKKIEKKKKIISVVW